MKEGWQSRSEEREPHHQSPQGRREWPAREPLKGICGGGLVRNEAGKTGRVPITEALSGYVKG